MLHKTYAEGGAITALSTNVHERRAKYLTLHVNSMPLNSDVMGVRQMDIQRVYVVRVRRRRPTNESLPALFLRAEECINCDGYHDRTV